VRSIGYRGEDPVQTCFSTTLNFLKDQQRGVTLNGKMMEIAAKSPIFLTVAHFHEESEHLRGQDQTAVLSFASFLESKSDPPENLKVNRLRSRVARETPAPISWATGWRTYGLKESINTELNC
jgi:hypothetical protein